MFNLANIFGIGKSENPSSLNLNDNNHSSSSSTPDTAYFENDLGDWILIDPEIEKKNELAVAKVTVTAEEAALKPRKSRKSNRSKLPVEKVQSLEESSWHIDPPECFKASPELGKVETSSSLENLLIEIPNMSVFDNMFTKRVLPMKVEPLKKPNLKLVAIKKGPNAGEGAKENNNPATARSNNKKKPLEVASVNVLPVFQKTKGTSIDKSTNQFKNG